jgi:type I restriction enzyme, S subunit
MSFGHDIAALVAEFERGLLSKNPRWPRVKLSEVADLLNGFPYESTKFSDASGIPLLRIRDILPGRTETRYKGSLDDPRMFKVRNGDLVVGMDGDFNARIWEGGEVLLNQRVCLIRAREEIYSQKFLAYILPGYLKLINDNTSSVTVKHLSSKTVQDTPLPLPPLTEQRRIVARVDALFAEIAEGEAALAAARKGLDTFRRALLKAAVTGGLTKDWRTDNPATETGHDILTRIAKHRAGVGAQKARGGRTIVTKPLDISALPHLPEGWAWASLGEIGEIVGGATVDKKRKPTDPVTVPYLRVANVQRGHVDLLKVKSITVERTSAEKLRLIAGDLLLNEGGDRDKIGRGWVWDGTVPDMIHQNHVFRVRLHSDSLNPFFVSHYANEMGRRFFIEGGKQTTNLASISLSKISMLPVPIPPPAEAAEILRRVSNALAAAADVLAVFDAEAADAARLKQSILKAAFEGRLVAEDVVDEPATALLARLAAKTPAVRASRGRVRKSDA